MREHTKNAGLLIAFAMILATPSSIRASQVYSAVNDFSLSSNPNGAWQYLWNNGTTTSLMPDALTPAQTGDPGMEAWINNENNGIPDRAIVGADINGSTIRFDTIVLPTNLLIMDPESDTAITQWTAPSTGTWSISGLFQGIDTNESAHNVEIVENSSTVLLGLTSMHTYGQQVTFNDTVSLHAGDTIDFIVLGTSDGHYLSTGFAATITSQSVPEPPSLMMLGTAGLMIVGYVCHKRRKPIVA